MIVFILIAAIMLAWALFFALFGLLRRQQGKPALQATHAARDALNLDVLRDQLRELDVDLQNGTIAAAAYQSAREDIERRVAEESEGESSPLPALAGQRRTAIVLGLAITVLAGFLYALLGEPNALLAVPALAPAPDAAAVQDAPQMSQQQIEGMVAGLAAKLKANPDDVEGWRMLARSYETLRRFDQAVEAYRHLSALVPNDADVLTDYAVTLAMTLNQQLSGEPEKLINRALTIDPNNVQALALSGSAAFERKEYDKAVQPWKKILALVPPDSDMARSIGGGIAKAESLAKSESAPAQ